jgi:UDP-N-acetylmuramoyl-L-alanyl-D-glutamate--2,6-diaminopimelate ligase
MLLSTLLAPFTNDVIPDIKITGIQNDSRLVESGHIFLAYPGALVDGRQYMMDALMRGAIAIVYEPEGLDNALLPTNITTIPLKKIPQLLSAIASRYYNYPSKVLSVSGVTGTNGKTTIAYQLAQAYQALGAESRYIGTLGEGPYEQLRHLPNTTPDGLLIQKTLYRYCQEGVQQVAMEVSSHALTLGRVEDVAFSQAIYTNLSHDHLDFHHNMDEYANAKAKLFQFQKLKSAIINLDDKYASLMAKQIQAPNCDVYRYGMSDKSDIYAYDVHVTMRGTSLKIQSPWGQSEIFLKALGQFNVYNGLAVFASLMAKGYPLSSVERVISSLRAAPGRMDLVSEEPVILVDFAHTPDALENVLSTLIPLKQGKLMVVFGCGGDRDKEKRPLMGRVAEKYADKIYITSDNPRHEDPNSILNEIEAGISDKSKLKRIENREDAISQAIEQCTQDDILVIAGKGHEQYQQIGDKKWPFSDKAIAKKYLKV